MGTGALFFLLGVMKMFGLWGMPGGPAAFGTLIWYAAIFELMIVAYYLGHVKVGGWNPAVNLGMPALLFMLAFLVILVYGARKASLEKAVLKKELF